MRARQVRATETTSCESYRELEPTLAERRRLVLRGLDRFRRAAGIWPTSHELFAFMQRTGLLTSGQDINSVRPRLTEMKQMTSPLVFNGAKRKCQETGKTVLTWELPALKLF